jgi:hypothetical protein
MSPEINITNIVEIFVFAATIVGVHVRNQVKQKEMEMKILALEQRLQAAEQDNHHIYKKLDQITDMLIEIKIELQRKQDRA